MLSMFSSGNSDNSGGFWAAFARILGLKPRSEWDLVKQREAMVSNLENQVVKQTIDQQQQARQLEFRYKQLAQQGQQFLAKLMQNREQFEQSLEFKKKQLADELGIKEKELDLKLQRLRYDKEYRDKKLGLANKEYDLDKKYKLGYLAVLQAKNDIMKDKMYMDSLYKERNLDMQQLRSINSFRKDAMNTYFKRLREAEKNYDNARQRYSKELTEYNRNMRGYYQYGRFSQQPPPSKAGVEEAYKEYKRAEQEYEIIKKLYPVYASLLNAKSPAELTNLQNAIIDKYAGGKKKNMGNVPAEIRSIYSLAENYKSLIAGQKLPSIEQQHTQQTKSSMQTNQSTQTESSTQTE